MQCTLIFTYIRDNIKLIFAQIKSPSKKIVLDFPLEIANDMSLVNILFEII